MSVWNTLFFNLQPILHIYTEADFSMYILIPVNVFTEPNAEKISRFYQNLKKITIQKKRCLLFLTVLREHDVLTFLHTSTNS